MNLIFKLVALPVLPLAASLASAQGTSFPSKSVRVVVPFAAGGTTDIVTRILAQRLSESWGQQMIVDNRAGAGGNIGSEIVAKAPELTPVGAETIRCRH